MFNFFNKLIGFLKRNLKIKDLFIATFFGFFCMKSMSYMWDLHEIVYEKDSEFYFSSFLAGFIINLFSSKLTYKNGAVDNWNTWSSLAKSKGLNIFVYIFLISPLVVKTVRLVQFEEYLTPLFYAYWVCGVFIFLFIKFFWLLAPKIFLYSDFDDFKMKSGSLVDLRSDARLALDCISDRESKNKLYRNEEEFIGDDKEILNRILHNEVVNLNDAYAVIKQRLTYHNNSGRGFIALFLMIPAYLLPIVFIINVAIVFDEAYEVLILDGYLKCFFICK